MGGGSRDRQGSPGQTGSTNLGDRVGGGCGRAGLAREQSGWWAWTDLGDRVGDGSGRADLGDSGWWEW